MSKATRFKVKIIKALHQEEKRPLQKDILEAMIQDEMPEEIEQASIAQREVGNNQEALPQGTAQLSLPEAAIEKAKEEGDETQGSNDEANDEQESKGSGQELADEETDEIE